MRMRRLNAEVEMVVAHHLGGRLVAMGGGSIYLLGKMSEWENGTEQ